jgi:arylsulfatase A-like enzyme
VRVRDPGVHPANATGRPARQPAGLVVLITVDQMRADYLDRFGPQLTGGLARLMRNGAWFTNAHQDHAITETAPGHAPLLSGRFPRSTGIAAIRAGVDDGASPLIDVPSAPGASPRRCIGTTLVDWLKDANRASRTLSVSRKDRGAILPVGRAREQVYWYVDHGRFTTSRYYAARVPPWVRQFNDRKLPASYAGRNWTPLLPDSAYHERDSVAVEGGGAIESVFPHGIPNNRSSATVLVQIMPWMDDIVLALALQGMQTLKLGSGLQTDVLAISLSSTDAIGHAYGPDSKEIHDQVLRVDRAIGVFLDSLYRLRDSTRIAVVFTSDHGVGTIPEIASDSVRPRPTRVSLHPLLGLVRQELAKARVDTSAIDVDEQIVMVNRAAFRHARVNADSVLDEFARRAREILGVSRVDRFKDLLAGDTIGDPLARRWTHQFSARDSVELVVTLTPLSVWGFGNVAGHGSLYDYDTHVPLIFLGAWFRPGRYPEFVRSVEHRAHARRDHGRDTARATRRSRATPSAEVTELWGRGVLARGSSSPRSLAAAIPISWFSRRA